MTHSIVALLLSFLSFAAVSACPGVSCPTTDTPGRSRAVVHLQDGSTLTARICGPEQYRYYSLDVPRSKKLLVKVTVTEGVVAGIYLKKDECPTQECADAYHVAPLSNNRTVSLCSNGDEGKWRIGVLSGLDYKTCADFVVSAGVLEVQDFDECELKSALPANIPFGAIVLLSLTCAIFIVTSAMGLCVFFRARAGLPPFPWQIAHVDEDGTPLEERSLTRYPGSKAWSSQGYGDGASDTSSSVHEEYIPSDDDDDDDNAVGIAMSREEQERMGLTAGDITELTMLGESDEETVA